MSAPAGYNYAKSFGIELLAPAVVFAVLYVPFFLWNLRQAISRPTYVYIVLSLFCAFRITAFIMRALLASVASDGENLNLLIAYEVIYNVGFFGLLYSAYTLVLDRGAFSHNLSRGPIASLLRQRFLFRLFLTAAVAIGITGAVESSSATSVSTRNTGNTLREAAIYIFLVLAILVLLQTVLLIRAEIADGGYKSENPSIGSVYGIYILALISILLIAREAFFTATSQNTTEQNKEVIWYPLSALTEFLVVVLFATPGLVPARSEIPTEKV